jgi:hypothetical protein
MLPACIDRYEAMNTAYKGNNKPRKEGVLFQKIIHVKDKKQTRKGGKYYV